MNKIKITREIGASKVTFPLTYSSRDLGYIIDTESVSDKVDPNTNIISYKGKNRLNECVSFNIKIPYIIGVNGVKNIVGDKVIYEIDEITYETDVNTGETFIQVFNKTENYINTHYIRDNVGMVENTNVNNIIIERGDVTVVESFMRIKNIKTLKDFNETGFGFYKVFNQTI